MAGLDTRRRSDPHSCPRVWDDGFMPRDALLAPLFALSAEKVAALLAHRPWPGEEHGAIRASESYLAFAEVAVAESPKLGRLMAGGTLNVAHELGGYSATQPDGAWVISRLLEDGTRLAAAQGKTNREAVHRGLREALNGFLDALGHGACPTTTYVGLRGISLRIWTRRMWEWAFCADSPKRRSARSSPRRTLNQYVTTSCVSC